MSGANRNATRLRPFGCHDARSPLASGCRAQTTLPALAVALVLLTIVTGLSLAMADSAISGADRTPDERRVAAAVADQLVAGSGPLATRQNVLNRTLVRAFDRGDLERVAPPARNYAVRVSLSGTEVTSSGDPSSGTRIRRTVLVEQPDQRTVVPTLAGGMQATLPRRASAATITIDPPNGTTVWTVRANDRVVLHNDSGLVGTFDVELVPYETTQLRFQHAGRLQHGNVTVAYDATQSSKATLVVTVDA